MLHCICRLCTWLSYSGLLNYRSGLLCCTKVSKIFELYFLLYLKYPAGQQAPYIDSLIKWIHPIFCDDSINSKPVQISKSFIKIRSENPCVGVRIDSRSLKHEVRSYLVFYSRHAIYSLIFFVSLFITFSWSCLKSLDSLACDASN